MDVLHEQIHSAVLGVGGLGGGALTIFKGRLVYHKAEDFILHQRGMVLAYKKHLEFISKLNNRHKNATSSKMEGYEKMTVTEQKELVTDNTMFYQSYRAILNERTAQASRGEASFSLTERWGGAYVMAKLLRCKQYLLAPPRKFTYRILLPKTAN